jgi:hypothetical protein
VSAAGLRPGQILRDAVRHEWDALQPGCTATPPTVLFRYDGAYPADGTLMRTRFGGQTFALGTEGFGVLVDGYGKRRCSVNVKVERFLRLALASLAGLRAGRLPPLGPACPRRVRSGPGAAAGGGGSAGGGSGPGRAGSFRRVRPGGSRP